MGAFSTSCLESILRVKSINTFVLFGIASFFSFLNGILGSRSVWKQMNVYVITVISWIASKLQTVASLFQGKMALIELDRVPGSGVRAG